MYKTKLQELCQRRQWELPKYSTMKDGSDHNPCFKATVSVNGQHFQSLASRRSSKQAQNDVAQLAFLHFTSPSDVKRQCNGQLRNCTNRQNCDLRLQSIPSNAASHDFDLKLELPVDRLSSERPDLLKSLKAALMSPSTNGFQEGDSGFFKNLLQELTQKEDLSMPVYKTVKSGAPHMPTFISSVEIDDEIFYGKAGKSKKLAEMNAAKTAYSVLKDRAMKKGEELALPKLEADGALCPDPSSDSTTSIDLKQSVEQKCQLSSPLILQEEHFSTENEESANAKVGSEDSVLPPAAVTVMDEVVRAQSLLSSSELEEGLWSSSISISSSSVRKSTRPSSYLLCNRFRVYTCYPDIAFPEGITILPIGDDKWVAVSLEFFNEQDC